MSQLPKLLKEEEVALMTMRFDDLPVRIRAKEVACVAVSLHILWWS